MIKMKTAHDQSTALDIFLDVLNSYWIQKLVKLRPSKRSGSKSRGILGTCVNQYPAGTSSGRFKKIAIQENNNISLWKIQHIMALVPYRPILFQYSKILQYHWLSKVKQHFIAD